MTSGLLCPAESLKLADEYTSQQRSSLERRLMCLPQTPAQRLKRIADLLF
jgi:hypothetical protein